MSSGEHRPGKGYEELAFFGINSLPTEREVEEEATRFAASHAGSYILAEADGYWVFGPTLPPRYESALKKYLSAPVLQHIKRWERKD